MDKLGPKTESPNYWWLKLANEKDEKAKDEEKDEKEKDEEKEI